MTREEYAKHFKATIQGWIDEAIKKERERIRESLNHLDERDFRSIISELKRTYS